MDLDPKYIVKTKSMRSNPNRRDTISRIRYGFDLLSAVIKQCGNFGGLLGSLQLLLRPGIELGPHWPEVVVAYFWQVR